MKMSQLWLRTLLILLLTSPATIMAAEDVFGDEIETEPTLVSITYISLRDRQEKSVNVPYKIGQQISAEAGKGVDRITIKPGDLVESQPRPGDVRLNLYRGAGRQRVLIGALDIRFYQEQENEWRPRFVLASEPIIIRQGDRLVPVETTAGGSGIVLEGGNLPNAEGYYSELTFTQGLGKTFIDSWQIFKNKRF